MHIETAVDRGRTHVRRRLMLGMLVGALLIASACGSDPAQDSTGNPLAVTTTDGTTSTAVAETTTTTEGDCDCEDPAPAPKRSEVEAELEVAMDVRARLIDAGIDCTGEPEVTSEDPFEIGTAVTLACTVDGATIDLGVFRTTVEARSGIETLQFVNCAFSGQPSVFYVDGGTWALTAASSKTTIASETRTKPVADALGEEVMEYTC